MIIYWSMLFWAPLFYFIYSRTSKSQVTLTDYNNPAVEYDKVPMLYAVLVFGYFIFWTGMRTYYADTAAYIAVYQKITPDWEIGFNEIDWEGKNPGFDIFNLFFKCFISQDFQWWLMTIAIVSGVCVMLTLRKYSIDYFFSCFMFIAVLNFTWMMNGMRQFICVAIAFACTQLVKEGKFFKYAIIILLLSTIHTTAVIMIPLYFVLRSETWSWKTMAFVAGMVVVVIFAEPLFSGVEDMLSGTAYAGTTEQFANDDGVNPIRTAFYMLPIILAFWRRKNLEAHYEKYPVLPICINASLITASLYFVATFTSGILVGRIPIYCELYNLILVPFILELGFDDNDNNKKVVKILFIIILLAYFYIMSQGQWYVSEFTGYVY